VRAIQRRCIPQDCNWKGTEKKGLHSETVDCEDRSGGGFNPVQTVHPRTWEGSRPRGSWGWCLFPDAQGGEGERSGKRRGEKGSRVAQKEKFSMESVR